MLARKPNQLSRPNFRGLFSVLPDRVRVFLKCHKEGLATHVALEEIICGPLPQNRYPSILFFFSEQSATGPSPDT